MGKQFIEFDNTTSIDNATVIPLQKTIGGSTNQKINWSSLKTLIHDFLYIGSNLRALIDTKVEGPTGATDGRVAVYDGGTGTLIKNGTKAEVDLVTGPAGATTENITTFNGITGKVIKDSGKAIATTLGVTDGDIPTSLAVRTFTLNQTGNNDLTRNAIINGNFDFWQRGTSLATGGYLADRFNLTLESTTATQSRQAFTTGQTGVPGNPKYYHRTVVTLPTLASSYCFLTQPIEDVRTFQNSNITLQFWAKADSNKSMTVEIEQVFGTGEEASVSALGLNKIALTSTWTKYTLNVSIPSITGKTIGTANDYLALNFWTSAGSNYATRSSSLGLQSGTFDIANIQLCQGTYTSLPEHRRHYATELEMCQRYFEKSYSIEEAIGSTIGHGIRTASKNPHREWVSYKVKKRKRVPPTIYSTSTGTVGYIHNVGGGNVAVTVDGVSYSEHGGMFYTGLVNSDIQFAYTADAEI